MPEISSLNRPRLTAAAVDVDGETVNLVVDVNRITLAWCDQVMGARGSDNIAALADALASVIDSWDVTEDGRPFPPTPENIATLSMDLSGMLFHGITDAAFPASAEGNASRGRSNTPSSVSTELPETHRNGQATSPLPAPSASLYPR